MLRIAVVGDLSMQDPQRFDHALSEAFKNADIIVQVGDMHPAYDVVKKYTQWEASTGKKFFYIPGNHDLDWDAKMPGAARQWVHSESLVHMIGLDNGQDHYNDQTWQLLATADQPENANKFLFIFTHKPLTTIVLPDGTESQHIMGEGGGQSDSKRLQDWLRKHENALLVCGHYHGWTFQHTNYCDVLVEGRGGAAPQLGYTMIFVQPEGWVFHPVNL